MNSLNVIRFLQKFDSFEKDRFALIFLVFIWVLTLASCAPKSAEVSELRIQFPTNIQRTHGLSQFSDDQSVRSFVTLDNLDILIVNVTGPNIAHPIFYQWEKPRFSESGNSILPPSNIDLAVPKGSARLIQVLAVFTGTNNAMAFFYGDAQKDLSLESEAVGISLTAVGGVTSGEGMIAGRFLTEKNSGPTGTVSYKLNIPNKPAMLIHTGEIFNGWFNFFALQGASFSYEMENGFTLFKEVSALTDSLVYSGGSSQKTMRMSVPAYYRTNYVNGVSSNIRELEVKRKLVLGFFGPGVDSEKICYDPSQKPLSEMYVDAVSNDVLNWSPLSPNPTSVFIDGVGGSLGGVANSDAVCADDSNRFLNHITVESSMVNYHDGILGFQGPFQLFVPPNWQQSTFVYYNLDTATGKMTVSWKYIPGVIGHGVDGVGVFFRTGNTIEDYHFGDGYSCEQLPMKGFSEVQRTTDATESVVIGGVLADDLNQGRVKVILCPYTVATLDGVTKTRYFRSAIELHSGGSSSGSGPMGPPLAVKLALLGPDKQVNAVRMFNSTCTPIVVQGQTSDGQAAQVNSGVNIQISGTSGPFSFFEDPKCSGSALAFPWSGLSGSTERTIYLRRDVTGAVASTLNITDPSSILASGVLSVSYQDPMNANKIRTLGPSSLVAHQCYPIAFQTRYADPSGEIVAAYSSSSISISLPAVSGLEFFAGDDQQCSGAPISLADAATLGYYSGSVFVTTFLNFRYSGTTGFSLLPTATAPFASSIAGLNFSGSQIVQPGPISKVAFHAPGFVNGGLCQALSVVLTDTLGYPSPVQPTTNSGNAVSISLNTNPAGSGEYYLTDSECQSGTGMISVLDFGLGESSEVVYFKAIVENMALELVAGSSAPTLSTSHSLSIGAAVADHLLIALPGQTYSGSGISGVPTPVESGIAYAAYLYAVTSSGSIDTNFNTGTVSVAMSGPAGFSYAGSTSFSAGVATLNIQYTAIQYGGNALSNVNVGVLSALAPSSDIQVIPPGHPSQSLSLAVQQLGPGDTIFVNNCVPFMATLIYSGNAVPADVVYNLPVNVSGSAGLTVHTLADCSDVSISNVTFNLGQSAKLLYFKSGIAGSIAGVGLGIGGGLSSGTNLASMTSAVGSPATTAQLLVGIHPIFTVGTCQPVMIGLYDGDAASPHSTPSAGAPVVTLNSTAGGNFFGSPSCSPGTAIANVNMTVGDRAVLVYFKTTTNAGGQSIMVSDGIHSKSVVLTIQ